MSGSSRSTPLTRRLLPALTFLIGVHSCILGLAMLLFPTGIPRLLGFTGASAPFFASQSGIFLLLLGVCYLLAVRERALLTTIVVSKAFAVGFLVVQATFFNAPPILWAAAVGDASMLGGIWLLMWAEGVPAIPPRRR